MSRIVVGMTTSTTIPSRQPIASVISTTIETVASAKMEQAARSPSRSRSRRSCGVTVTETSLGTSRPSTVFRRCEELVGDDDGIGALALGEGDGDGRAALERARLRCGVRVQA